MFTTPNIICYEENSFFPNPYNCKKEKLRNYFKKKKNKRKVYHFDVSLEYSKS